MVNLTLSGKSGQIVCELSLLDIIREYFSIPNPAKRAGSKHFISSRLYSITPSGKFDVGLVSLIVEFLKKENLQYHLDKQLSSQFIVGFSDIPEKLVGFEIYDYIYYQEEAIRLCLKIGRGIVLLPTAAGKTLTCAGLIENFKVSAKKPNLFVLVVVPSIQLVEQTCSDFIQYGIFNVHKWSGKNKLDTDCGGIIVTNTQNLLSKKVDLSFLADVDLLLIDECHGIRRQNSINKIFKFVKTKNIFGFTGTLPDDKMDQWNIIGKIGPVLYQKRSYEISRNISPFNLYILNFKSEKTKFPVNHLQPLLAYQNEVEYLIVSEPRNNMIKNLAAKLGTNTIIMVERLDHGETLLNLIKSATDRPVFFIHGKVEMEERENVRKLMDENNDIIVIAISRIFSTGINIPNLRNIIFASTGKAKIRIMQTIGRALRKHPTKEIAYIFDIADNTPYAMKHLEQRISLYSDEKYTFFQKDI